MITQDRLKQLLNYNQETGIFTWVCSRTENAQNRKANAGTLPELKGVRQVPSGRWIVDVRLD